MSVAMPKNILVVDGDKQSALKLSVLLKRLEYNVFAVTEAKHFIRTMARIMPNAVLLNHEMKSPEGKFLFEYLRGNPAFSSTKVVTMGEEKDIPLLKESLKKGAHAYIVRPVKPTALYYVMEQITENSRRKTPRLRVVLPVVMEDGKGNKKRTFASMLSERGLFVRTLKPYRKGTKIKFHIDLMGDKPIEIMGEVRYSISPSQKKDIIVEPGMGIMFVDLKKNVQEGLRNLVEGYLAHDLDAGMEI